MPLRLGPAPRAVPWLLQQRLRFGGVLGTVGWGVAAFGMLFVLTFGGSADLGDYGPSDHRRGRVLGSEATSMKENDRYIYAVEFESIDDGLPLRGKSYKLGGGMTTGEEVVLIVPVGKPEHARIDGLRRKPFGAFVLFVVIFPVVGLGLALPAFVRGRRAVRLLRVGCTARGKLIDKHDTRVRVNKRPVWLLTFEFEDANGRKHRASARTHQPELLEDDELEPLLYDPVRPGQCTLLDHLPGGPRIDDRGQIQSRHPALGVLAVALPVVFALELLVGAAMLL